MKQSIQTPSLGITSRLIAPILFIVLFIGFGLYYFNLRFVSETAKDYISENLNRYGKDIYNICDRHFTNFVEYGYLDPIQERIMQVNTIKELESYAQRHNFIVVLTDKDGNELISSSIFSSDLLKEAMKNKDDVSLAYITHLSKRYYVMQMDFQPLQWTIYIATAEEEFSILTSKVKQIYLLTAVIVIVTFGLLFVLINKTILKPLSVITSYVTKNQRPDYTGIKEFELLSNTISQMMDSIESHQQLFRDITSSMAEGLCVQDIEGRLTFMNPAAERMLQWSLDELVGKNTHETIHYHPKYEGYFVDASNCPIISVAKTGVPYSTENDHFVRKDGSLLPVAYIASPMKRGDEITGIITSFRDISELKIAQEQKQSLQNQLNHSQKMEAVGLLAGGIAHDFNNILTTIIGYCSLIKGQSAKDATMNRYIDNIISSAERASNLIRQLLAFSRKQTPSMRPLEINSMIADLEGLIIRLIGEDIKVVTRLHKERLFVEGDKGQLEQVLINLVTNARDAMPKGGRLTISTEALSLNEKEAQKRGLRPGDYAVISVADTGKGIDNEIIDKIFDPFFTTKAVGKGTGLGLSIVYGIVKQHQGEIKVNSELNKGTIFKIYLPIIRDDYPEDEEPKDEACHTCGSETILLAEDDSSVREIIKITLESAGYSVIEAADGLEALSIFKERSHEIDLFLSDVVMPVMNGQEAYLEIRAIKPDIKAIFMSGYTKDIIDRNIEAVSAVEILPKPVSPKELLSKIRATLQKGQHQDS